MKFFLEFTLISYAAVIFFTIGVGLALSAQNKLTLIKLGMIFMAMAVFLSLSLNLKPLRDRMIISVVWTSVLGSGFRFGRKVIKRYSYPFHEAEKP